MEIYVATQPIFDENEFVYAYEVLFRNSNINSYSFADGDEASSKVIVNTFNSFGIEKVTNGKPAFINFTANLIKEEVATIFPPTHLVVEILETVEPDDDIIEKCASLKKSGYIIALDDFVFDQKYESLIKLADIIKVDFLNTPDEEKARLANKYKNSIKMLAEKIETRDDFEKAKKMGYTLFQGYFFSKPVMMSMTDIPIIKFMYLQLISKVTLGELNFEEIASIISSDVSLSYKLLRLVNSVAFGFRNKITNIKQAVVALGERELKKWVCLVAIKGIGDDKPDQIIRTSLLRARFLELLSNYTPSLNNRKSDLFLTGMFSMLDVVMHRPLEELLEDIYVSNDIKNVLLENKGTFIEIYNLISFYERGDWNMVQVLANKLQLNEEIITKSFLEASIWTNQIMDS
jgi:EAL and modified HD-GYP domain-containing signal transduction protein